MKRAVYCFHPKNVDSRQKVKNISSTELLINAVYSRVTIKLIKPLIRLCFRVQPFSKHSKSSIGTVL